MKTIWCNGTFDVLHSSHIKLLKSARHLSCGGHVIVGLDSDSRVSDKKGSKRPFKNYHERKTILESIKYVDMVFEFYTDLQLENLVKMVSPDIMLLGSDYENQKIIGADFAKEVRFLERIDDLSTSAIINKIES